MRMFRVKFSKEPRFLLPSTRIQSVISLHLFNDVPRSFHFFAGVRPPETSQIPITSHMAYEFVQAEQSESLPTKMVDSVLDTATASSIPLFSVLSSSGSPTVAFRALSFSLSFTASTTSAFLQCGYNCLGLHNVFPLFLFCPSPHPHFSTHPC